MSTPIKVMLVDDHAVVRMGFRLLLEGTPDIRVVVEAETGEQACRVFPEAQPDVVVLDISMPGIGGLETLARLVACEPAARVLLLSVHEDNAYPRRALKIGARGYLTKRSAPEELIAAVRDVARGKIFLEPAIARNLALKEVHGGDSPMELLTDREFTVFLALARGQSVNDIAAASNLSPRTVGTHLYHIKQKLDAGNAAELALIAIRNGLIEA